jgi:hypothetical protein
LFQSHSKIDGVSVSSKKAAISTPLKTSGGSKNAQNVAENRPKPVLPPPPSKSNVSAPSKLASSESNLVKTNRLGTATATPINDAVARYKQKQAELEKHKLLDAQHRKEELIRLRLERTKGVVSFFRLLFFLNFQQILFFFEFQVTKRMADQLHVDPNTLRRLAAPMKMKAAAERWAGVGVDKSKSELNHMYAEQAKTVMAERTKPAVVTKRPAVEEFG